MNKTLWDLLAEILVLKIQCAYTSPGIDANGDSLRKNANGRAALIKKYPDTPFCVGVTPSDDRLQSKRGIPIGFRTTSQREDGS